MAISKRAVNVSVKPENGKIDMNINISIDLGGLTVRGVGSTGTQDSVNDINGTGELVPEELIDFDLPTVEFGDSDGDAKEKPIARKFRFEEEQ
jgi:hypothetical protein